MAAHRYIRLKIDQWGDNGRHCTVANEVEFIGPANEDLTTVKGGTPIGSTQNYGGTYGGAFDRNGGATYWHSDCQTWDWIGWDFGADDTKWIEPPLKFAWTSRDDGGYGFRDSPKIAGIEWSDNGVDWTREWTCLPLPNFGGNDRKVAVYTPPPAYQDDGHRYWRLFNLWHNANQTGISELELVHPDGTTLNGIIPITASASGTYGGFYGPDRAFNGERGNANGEWAQNGGRGGSWLQADFGDGHNYRIDKIRISPFSDNGGTPRTFFWQWSDDGVTWTTHFIGIYDGEYPWGGAIEFSRPVSQPFNRYCGFAVRVSAGEKYYGQAGGSYKDLVVREVEMAETPAGPNICVGGAGHWYPGSAGAAPQLFNGDLDGEEYNGSGMAYPAIWYDFGAGNEKALAEVRYVRGTDYNQNVFRSPAEGDFIYSQDGRSWRICNVFNDVAYAPTPGHAGYTGTFEVEPIPDEGGGGAATRRRMIVVT